MLSVRFCATALTLVVALLIGGGGPPLIDTVIELTGILLLIVVVALPGGKPAGASGALAIAAVALIVLVPLLQLIPLPPSVWAGLPGRAQAVAIGHLAGQDGLWRPISLDPETTRAAALALIPSGAMFLAVMSANVAERHRLSLFVIAVAVISAALGIAQIATRSEFLYPYETSHFGLPVGLFANRNHEADLLIIGILFTIASDPASWRKHGGTPTRMAVALFLAIAIVTTRSRTGVVLLCLTAPLAVVALRLQSASQRKLQSTSRRKKERARATPKRKPAMWLYGGALAAVLLTVTLLAGNAEIQKTLTRFAALSNDSRPIIWATSIAAIKAYWPIGSGLGTFVPIYATQEPLASMSFAYVNHAHNDFLEIAIETGALGIVVALVTLALLGRQILRPASSREYRLRLASTLSILVLVLHSLTDYPLRNQSLMILFAMFSGFLFASQNTAERPMRRAVPKREQPSR